MGYVIFHEFGHYILPLPSWNCFVNRALDGLIDVTLSDDEKSWALHDYRLQNAAEIATEPKQPLEQSN